MRLGVERPEVDGVDGDVLRTLCRGGDGARVEEECVPLEKRRDMEAVAVDADASGGLAGVMGNRCDKGTTGGGGGTGCSSRILRRLFTVILARHSSEEDEEGDSSIVGIGIGLGVWERERRDLLRGASGDFPPRSVLVLVLRLDRKDDRREEVEE